MPAKKTDRGIRLAVRVLPRGSKNELVGVMTVEGESRVKLKLTAPPVEGAANAAGQAFLADLFGVAKGAVSLVAGAKSREKAFEIAGDPTKLWGRWLELFSKLPAD